MRYLVVLIVLLAVSVTTLHASLYDASANAILQRYRYRVKILHELLLAENCTDPDSIRNKREIITEKDANLIQVEKMFLEQLNDMLISCRKSKQLIKSITNRPTPKSTTATSTTTPTPSTTTVRPPEECRLATNLTEYWREDYNGSLIRPIGGSKNSDLKDMITQGRPWFRFTGAAGNMMLNRAVPENSCGTHIGLWTGQSGSASVGVGVADNITVYGNYNNGNVVSFQVSVMRRSNIHHDVIYRYVSDQTGCCWGFCGMTSLLN